MSGAVWCLLSEPTLVLFLQYRWFICGNFTAPSHFLELIQPVICISTIIGNLTIFPRKVHHSIAWPKHVLNSASGDSPLRGSVYPRLAEYNQRQTSTDVDTTGICPGLCYHFYPINLCLKSLSFRLWELVLGVSAHFCIQRGPCSFSNGPLWSIPLDGLQLCRGD